MGIGVGSSKICDSGVERMGAWERDIMFMIELMAGLIFFWSEGGLEWQNCWWGLLANFPRNEIVDEELYCTYRRLLWVIKTGTFGQYI